MKMRDVPEEQRMTTESLSSPPASPGTNSLGKGILDRRSIMIVVSVLVAAKVVVLAGTFVLFTRGNFQTFTVLPTERGFTAMVHTMATNWDAYLYQSIASTGYPRLPFSELYAFSPFYPALIYLGHFATGSYWTAALLVTNLLSFVFPIILLKLFDLRTALLAEVFPVYVAYSLVGYSDMLALVFLGLGLLAFVRGRRLAAGVCLALAGLVFYDLLVAAGVATAYGALLAWGGRASVSTVLKTALPLLLPGVVAGVCVLGVYWVATGSPFTFLKLEHELWSVGAATPWGQIEWLYNGHGEGSFDHIPWLVDGISLSSTYWVLRNVFFEAFFFAGVCLLAALKGLKERWLLVGFSLVLSVPLLFVQGTPVYSIPRLLLAAFPVFFGYSRSVVNRKWKVAVYTILCLAAAVWALLTFTVAFFA